MKSGNLVLLGWAGMLIASAGLADAATPPTCAQLSTSPAYGLVSNPQIVAGTLASAIAPAAAATPAFPPLSPTPVPVTPAYCQVSFTFSSGLSGPSAGYDVGQTQKIQIVIVLPLSAADGGVTGSLPSTADGGTTLKTIQGNWIGKLMVGASPGSSGQIGWAPFSEGLNGGRDPSYAIRLGYVGSETDTGQHNPPFVLIPTGPLANTLALGTIEDWVFRGTHYGKQWATTIAQTYYGRLPTRTYYNGISGAGNEGMGQLMHFGDEYDGFLIGAPAFYWDQFILAYAWPYVVFKKLVQQGGTIPTLAQETALGAAVVAACDGLDGVVDGIINDPRQCTFSATANICGKSGAPAAPNCLTPAQAAAFDRMWAGPRNKFGHRVWFPYEKSIPFSLPFPPPPPLGFMFTVFPGIPSNLTGLAAQVIQWNHKNLSFDPNNLFEDKQSLALAGNPPGGITYADEATLGSTTVADFSDNQNPVLTKALSHGTKVMHFHGTADPTIFWRTSADYYRRVATWNGKGKANFAKLQDWYRFYPLPGVGHGIGSAAIGSLGPSPDNPFPALVNWVERGVPPDLTALMAPTSPATPTISFNPNLPPGSTRPLCPYPQTAIYNGSGSTTVATSFHCGGNLETTHVVCDDLRTVYKHENDPFLDFRAVGVDPDECSHERNDDRDASVGRGD
jgi:hypothetical protein